MYVRPGIYWNTRFLTGVSDEVEGAAVLTGGGGGGGVVGLDSLRVLLIAPALKKH